MGCGSKGIYLFVCLSFPHRHGQHLNPFPLFSGGQEGLRNVTRIPLGGGGAAVSLYSVLYCPLSPPTPFRRWDWAGPLISWSPSRGSGGRAPRGCLPSDGRGRERCAQGGRATCGPGGPWGLGCPQSPRTRLPVAEARTGAAPGACVAHWNPFWLLTSSTFGGEAGSQSPSRPSCEKGATLACFLLFSPSLWGHGVGAGIYRPFLLN